MVETEAELIGLAKALATAKIRGRSAGAGAAARDEILAGRDPLGEAFCRLRSPAERRPRGATYTPQPIVHAMVRWAAEHGEPARVVDPGAGSGRFLVEAGRVFPRARLVGLEIDPVAALLCRAHLAAAGMAARAEVRIDDYRAAAFAPAAGPTLFVGNPPYVRHHAIEPCWKAWLTREARRLGLPCSQLAGLHVYFLLATRLAARPGDHGCFITAAEWLDVNYGALARTLLVDQLGLSALHVLEPTVRAFEDAATTAVISCFRVGERPAAVAVRRVAALDELEPLRGGAAVAVASLRASSRWTTLTRPRREAPAGFVELGELCRVSRGQVTGANDFWIEGPHAAGLPASVLYPTVTRARELIAAAPCLSAAHPLRRVIDLPEDLDELSAEARRRVEAMLRRGRAAGVHLGYIASHRRAWWAVRLHAPAPILATYMARRTPAFVRNLAGARHINIAHGLYPRVALTGEQLDALVAHLTGSATLADGRVYAGGLTKFEPREMERLRVPMPELLGRRAA